MTDGNLVPISDEQAKAIREALKTLQGIGGFLQSTFGTLPQDIVGMLGGDYLKVRRAENIVKMTEKAKKRLADRNVENADAPPSLAIPIMIAAGDESRDELQDLWAALLAAAADPGRNRAFRIVFIEAVKAMDPLDAVVLKGFPAKGPLNTGDYDQLAQTVGLRADQVAVSVTNLERLRLCDYANERRFVRITPLGRELLRTIE
ncbi:Abi-alpha family protein [Bradyrhizobium huanghuaihaiense]|uniref:Abi-alpha family protein n=1 Tax=Bradyrhizobium huanghuaihaiense TaxID=990078 RepID=UPI0021AA864A|nr:Abi-alpha family protein [Bradyrhizobium sp. CB3035]UWU76016.1 Abi-alpha family protein [Bradyrhizobium sp. CB3035]